MTAEGSEALIEAIRALAESGVLRIGALHAAIVRVWTSEVEGNRDVVLTGRQRAHYLARHPEMAAWEGHLAATVLDPDEVQRNRADPAMAIFYRQADERHYLRATVVMQRAPGTFKHSVITFRLAAVREVERQRQRQVWSKR